MNRPQNGWRSVDKITGIPHNMYQCVTKTYILQAQLPKI